MILHVLRGAWSRVYGSTSYLPEGPFCGEIFVGKGYFLGKKFKMEFMIAIF